MVTKHGYSETALFGASENLSFQPQVSKRVSTGTCQNLTSWTVRSAQVRKLVRTERDGAGHEVVKGLHPALLRPSGLMRPVRACAKRAGHAGAGAAMRHKVFV